MKQYKESPNCGCGNRAPKDLEAVCGSHIPGFGKYIHQNVLSSLFILKIPEGSTVWNSSDKIVDRKDSCHSEAVVSGNPWSEDDLQAYWVI